MDRLCKFIYTKDSTDRLRTRAILCQIYHNALHDRWYDARDLMLMSHLQDSVQHSDIPTQVLCKISCKIIASLKLNLLLYDLFVAYTQVQLPFFLLIMWTTDAVSKSTNWH
jgi:Eukaryotic translation initiation factor 3 subunit 8 N-terminus